MAGELPTPEPKAGEVRVKMTVANGGYLSGGISLTGTVQ